MMSRFIKQEKRTKYNKQVWCFLSATQENQDNCVCSLEMKTDIKRKKKLQYNVKHTVIYTCKGQHEPRVKNRNNYSGYNRLPSEKWQLVLKRSEMLTDVDEEVGRNFSGYPVETFEYSEGTLEEAPPNLWSKLWYTCLPFLLQNCFTRIILLYMVYNMYYYNT